jgi:hypothetical protein
VLHLDRSAWQASSVPFALTLSVRNLPRNWGDVDARWPTTRVDAVSICTTSAFGKMSASSVVGLLWHILTHVTQLFRSTLEALVAALRLARLSRRATMLDMTPISRLPRSIRPNQNCSSGFNIFKTTTPRLRNTLRRLVHRQCLSTGRNPSHSNTYFQKNPK